MPDKVIERLAKSTEVMVTGDANSLPTDSSDHEYTWLPFHNSYVDESIPNSVPGAGYTRGQTSRVNRTISPLFQRSTVAKFNSSN